MKQYKSIMTKLARVTMGHEANPTEGLIPEGYPSVHGTAENRDERCS